MFILSGSFLYFQVRFPVSPVRQLFDIIRLLGEICDRAQMVLKGVIRKSERRTVLLLQAVHL